MPSVHIKGVGSYLSTEQKQEMIRKVSDAVLSVEGEALRPVNRLAMTRQMAVQDK